MMRGVRLLPVLLGAVVALLLGGTGFGFGCLYASLDVPAVAVAVTPAALPAGGPDESDAVEPRVVPRLSLLPKKAILVPDEFAERLARPVVGGWVSSHYGKRADPFTGHPAMHRGLDFAGSADSVILAVAPGIVTWSGPLRGYGNLIEIDHGNGWVTRYGHNASNFVSPGDYVKPGQTIALMGATGRATGTHLHFEVLYQGRHMNPARFVPTRA
jgi:murein DD-endopeptidase MepM/ murein hydrolase activator NlpD